MCFSTARFVKHERLGDRRVALAGGDLGENLTLARSELAERRSLGARLGAHERLHDLGVDDRAAGRDRLDRPHELGAVVHALLQQICAPVRARVQQRERVGGLRILTEHYNARIRVGLPQDGREPNSLVGLRRWHADVRDHHVGARALDGFEQGVQVPARGDDLDVLVRGEELLDAFPDDEAVLGQGNPDGHTETLSVRTHPLALTPGPTPAGPIALGRRRWEPAPTAPMRSARRDDAGRGEQPRSPAGGTTVSRKRTT